MQIKLSCERKKTENVQKFRQEIEETKTKERQKEKKTNEIQEEMKWLKKKKKKFIEVPCTNKIKERKPERRKR